MKHMITVNLLNESLQLGQYKITIREVISEYIQ